MMKEVCPLMIACTSEDVEHPFIKNAILKAGFDFAITSPMTTSKVNDIIIKLIMEKDLIIYEKICKL
jgi:hypothetical protein